MGNYYKLINKFSDSSFLENELKIDTVTTTLGSLAEVKSGYAFQSSSFNSGEVPIIRISNIMKSGLVSGPYVAYNKDKSLDKYIVNKGEFVIAMSGATTGKVAKVSEASYVNQRVGYFKLKENVSPTFISILLNSSKFQYYLTTRWGAGAQPNVSSTDINNYKVTIPTEEKIRDTLGGIIDRYFEIIQNVQTKIMKKKQLKKSLLSILMI